VINLTLIKIRKSLLMERKEGCLGANQNNTLQRERENIFRQEEIQKNRSREKTNITTRYRPTVLIQEEPKFRHVFSLLFSVMILL